MSEGSAGSEGSENPESSKHEHSPHAAGPDPGLCALCTHVNRNETRKGMVYWRCTRAATDPRFPKYPRLPVLSCRGFEPSKPPLPS